MPARWRKCCGWRERRAAEFDRTRSYGVTFERGPQPRIPEGSDPIPKNSRIAHFVWMIRGQDTRARASGDGARSSAAALRSVVMVAVGSSRLSGIMP